MSRADASGAGPGEAPGRAGPGGASDGDPELEPRDGEGRPRVLLATRSRHKAREIRDLLGNLPVTFLSLEEAGVPEIPAEADERIEVHDTFAENALAKARHFHRRTGLPTVADDSGLCVDALEGGPGVRTKRFAPEEDARRLGRDEANNRHLVEVMEEVPDGERGAHYHCSAAVVTDDESFTVDGKVHGRIAREPRGEGGFGYDPLFVPEGRDRTFGELPPEVKQAVSHRSEAFRALRPWLERLAEGDQD